MTAPLNNTVRRHPRTLAEAFPDERALATQGNPYRISRLERVGDTLLAVVIGIVLAVGLVHYLSK